MIRCPHCGSEFEDPKGVDIGTQKGEEIDSGSEKSPEGSQKDKSANLPLLSLNSTRRGRGKAIVYTGAFEVAWRQYGRKEEKLRAYKEWVTQAPTVGGENRLLQLILAALKWQTELWAPDGWKFAKYFERYLKARKWEDEPPPTPIPQPNGTGERGRNGTAVLSYQERQRAAAQAKEEQAKRERDEYVARLKELQGGGH